MGFFYFSHAFTFGLSQAMSVENVNVAPMAITAFPTFRTASAFRAIAIWQEV